MSLNQRRIPWLMIVVLGCTVCALAFVKIGMGNGSNQVVVQSSETRMTPKPSLQQPLLISAELAQPSSQRRPQIRVEQLTLWPTGFKPAEITRAAGPIAFIVVNNSRREDLSFRLSDEKGNRLRTVRIAPGKREWREYLHLHPGIYIVSEANHPDWTCRLVITAR